MARLADRIVELRKHEPSVLEALLAKARLLYPLVLLGSGVGWLMGAAYVAGGMQKVALWESASDGLTGLKWVLFAPFVCCAIPSGECCRTVPSQPPIVHRCCTRAVSRTLLHAPRDARPPFLQVACFTRARLWHRGV